MGVPMLKQRFCSPSPIPAPAPETASASETRSNPFTTNPITSAGSITSLSLIDRTSPITSPNLITNNQPHSDASTPQYPSRMGIP